MAKQIFAYMLLFALTASVHAQFFDFFQGLQPLMQTTSRPITRHSTNDQSRHIKGSINNANKQTNSNESRGTGSGLLYGLEREEIRQPKDKKRKQESASISNYYTTTVKPIRKTNRTNSSHRNYDSNADFSNNFANTANSRNNKYVQEDTDYVSNHRQDRRDPIYEGKSNVIDYTTRPAYNYDSSINNLNVYTTHNPFYNKPGVRPTIVENRPAITNKPTRTTTRKPVVDRNSGGTAVAAGDTGPELITGMDEDYMSDVEKRRYIEISERMCDKYKMLNMKQLQAIPLIPSPEPVQVNVSVCAPTTIPLVVGGKVVTINEFPHMALLGWLRQNNAGYAWKCGGSLVSDQFVLTAAHCAYQERDNSVSIGTPRAVQLGSSYLDDPNALVVKVSSVIRHPKYKLPRSYYDLALVKLTTQVRFSEVVKPACLGVPPPVGEPIIATGWGKTEFGGDQSLELRSVSLPIWGMDECYNTLGVSRKLPNGPSSESQICAGDKRGGKDTCQGDSGGPAQIQDGCAWRVIAVTSLGRSCGAPHTPGLYATVQRVFIAATIFGGKLNKNKNQQEHNSNNQQNYNGRSINANSNNSNREQNSWNENERNRYTENYRQPNNNYFNYESAASVPSNFGNYNGRQQNYESDSKYYWT